MLSSLIESEFFPKWGEALWIWLKSDGVNLEQVAEWYSWWKSYFPEDVVSLKGVERGFRKGLDLMNQAMALGEDVKYRYDHHFLFSLNLSVVHELTCRFVRSVDSRNPISHRNNLLDLHPLHLHLANPSLRRQQLLLWHLSLQRSLSDRSSRISARLRICYSSRLVGQPRKVRTCTEYRRTSMGREACCVTWKTMSFGSSKREGKERRNRSELRR